MLDRAGDSAWMEAAKSTGLPARPMARAMLLNSTGSLAHQFIRYSIVSGFAFLVGSSSLYALTEFGGFHYLTSATVAVFLGLIITYSLSRRWVFDRRAVENVGIECLIFILIGVASLGLNEWIVRWGTERMQIRYLAAKGISAGIVLIWNFGAMRATLFSSNRAAVTVLNRMNVLVRTSYSSFVVGACYFLYCLVLQASSGAWQANFTGFSDEPSHFVGAALIRDWLLSGSWFAPIDFAKDYYRHYPYFAIGYWPPMFHAVSAIAFLVGGVGRIQALMVPAACAAATAWMIFYLLKKPAGLIVATSAGAIYLNLPVVKVLACVVMVDHMTACLSMATTIILIHYLKQPTYRNGFLFGVTCACAILTKYSAAYLVGLPFFAVLLFRKARLLRKPSFLIQPLIVALIAGPWAYWTRNLTFYGLPTARPALTAARLVSWWRYTFGLFPPVLLAVVILGLGCLLFLRKGWREELGVLALACAANVAFLFLSPVDPGPRYVLMSVACLLVLSFWGLAEAVQIIPPLRSRASVVYALVAVLTVAFAVVHFDDTRRETQYPIRGIVSMILSNKDWAGQTVVAPSDLEGPFIAEFVAQDRGSTHVSIMRPDKTLFRSDWFGSNYLPLFNDSSEMLEFFRQHPVRLIIWHERPAEVLQLSDRLLIDMLRKNPRLWRVDEAIGPAGAEETAWAIYEYQPPAAHGPTQGLE